MPQVNDSPESSALHRILFKDVEKNATQLEHLSISVAVMAKQWDNIQQNMERITNILEKLDNRLSELEKHNFREKGKEEAKKNIIDTIMKNWQLWTILILIFFSNDSALFQNVRAWF